MMRSWLASDVAISPTSRPSFITQIRSVMPRSSGISDEITMIAFPAAARSRMMV